eukprot:861002-Pleurochrysis_carterae.AAC.1
MEQQQQLEPQAPSNTGSIVHIGEDSYFGGTVLYISVVPSEHGDDLFEVTCTENPAADLDPVLRSRRQ